MKLFQLINKVDPVEVAKAYVDNYECKGWGKPETFIEFRDRLNDVVGIRETPEEQMTITIDWVVQDWSKFSEIKDIDEYFSVGGIWPKDDTNWSLSTTEWGAWKEMEFIDRTGKNLTEAQIAALIYYEMTWWGWPEKAEIEINRLKDAAEKCQRDFEGWKSGDPLPEGYTDATELFKKFKGDE